MFQITWVRRRDWHILASSLQSYIQDDRFRMTHPSGSDEWNLRIQRVRNSDSGSYECQVSTLLSAQCHASPAAGGVRWWASGGPEIRQVLRVVRPGRVAATGP